MKEISEFETGSTQGLFLEELRARTGALHRELEASGLSRRLTADDVRLEDYLRYLSYMRQVVQFIEHYAFPVAAALFTDMAQRSKLALIDRDIAVLSQMATVEPPAFNAEEPESVAAALGQMYVVEGATLGGRVLSAHVQKALGMDAHNGAAFFAGYGRQTGPLWKEFIRVMSDYAVQHNATDEIIQSSIAAFTSIKNYFT